jgi:hypothetical protein
MPYLSSAQLQQHMAALTSAYGTTHAQP